MIQKLIISAPFGNYISFPHATSTIGTFTLKKRGGRLYRLYRIARTLRPYPRLKSWSNKLGLPNPGIDVIKGKNLGGKIISIHGFTHADWCQLTEKVHDLPAVYPEAVELNVSCPNVRDEIEGLKWYREIFARAKQNIPSNVSIIVKLPPVNWERLFGVAYDEVGIKYFHCCNTLPVPSGGLSGKALKPASLEVINRISEKLQGDDGEDDHLLRIIGGGGITNINDLEDYKKAGADYFAVGSAFLNPFRHRGLKKMAKYLTTADHLLTKE